MSSITCNRWRLTSNTNQCTQSLSLKQKQWENSALIDFITQKEKEQKKNTKKKEELQKKQKEEEKREQEKRQKQDGNL